MLTRSSHAAGPSDYETRKSIPAILTRSRKRKSVVLQDEVTLNRLASSSACESRRRTRHSLSTLCATSDRHYANLFSSSEQSCERKISTSRRSRHSIGGSTDAHRSTSRDYHRRRLVERDYDTRSGTSSSSSSVVSSTISASTRRSKKSHSDEESILSCLSIDESLSGKSTPPNYKGLKPSKEDGGRIDNNTTRASPLPPVCFANCEEIWDLMCKMDIKYQKTTAVFKNHPILSPQMRAILIDWIMDVCEAYHLHRETLYLAIDYLDRYLASQENVMKKHLQLLGITALFVAAKLEEIYPPKLKTFAYVTDGACSESEILDMELVLMKTLKWKLTPITPATWTNIYLQVLSYRSGGIYCTRSGSDFLRASIRLSRDAKPEDIRLVKHLYDGIELVRALRVVDLAILDVQSLNFTYSTLAAAAIYHTKGRSAALLASGLKWGQLGPCVNWMAPFASVLRRNPIAPVLPSIEGVVDESRHLIQSQCVTLDMLEDAEALCTSKICSPLNNTEGGLLTPPRSSEKFRRCLQ